MPAYNEEAKVGTAARACAAAAKSSPKTTVIVVADGSRDRTSDVRASRRLSRIRAFADPAAANRGSRRAQDRAQGADKPHVFYTDSDLQFDLKRLPGCRGDRRAPV